MENASKALIIAGAILLSVLIVSLGIMVYNNARNTVGGANLSQQEIEAFNLKWLRYVGTTKSANDVVDLAQALLAHNAAETKNGTNRYITFKYNTADATPATTKPTISVPSIISSGTANATAILGSKTYTISPSYATSGATEGLIFCITFKPNT